MSGRRAKEQRRAIRRELQRHITPQDVAKRVDEVAEEHLEARVREAEEALHEEYATKAVAAAQQWRSRVATALVEGMAVERDRWTSRLRPRPRWCPGWMWRRIVDRVIDPAEPDPQGGDPR